MIKAASGLPDIDITMDTLGTRAGLQPVGEVLDLAGVLNMDAAYAVQRQEEAQKISTPGDWGYYAKQVANTSGQWFKAWVRWNPEEATYDYYLEAAVGEVFEHATPYIGTVY